MADEYRPLATLFHMDTSTARDAHLEELAQARLTADSTFRTGITTKLGELFVGMPRELICQLNGVLVRERSIAVLWNGIPRIMKHNYILHAISEEILSTNDIEGVRSTRKEVQDAVETAQHEIGHTVPPAPRDPYRTVRFTGFARLYLGLTDEHVRLPQTLDDLRAIYDDVIGDEIADEDRPDGERFRKDDVDIIGAGERVVHTGAHTESRIDELLTQMLTLMKSEQMPPVLAAAAAHFLFEYTHPFYDGNGRIGRYLLALNLQSTLTLPTVLSLSRTIADNRQRYYKAFGSVEQPLNHGELTFFIQMLLDCIAQAQHALIEQLTQRLNRLSALSTQCDDIAREHDMSDHARRTLYALMQGAAFGTTGGMTLDDAAQYLNLSKQSARKAVDELERLELIEFTKRRPLTFVYAGALPE
ncbi:cell division protein Fic [Bifidobacterium italicum]|uniref:Cell division protein Fic n=1 Tax=Bifidobacterium italicum TaxID=1960968 RepID=A0A2A2EL20_9BIFI|nr:Fic family protein [Bifidobacterium italicum]PAU69859.1 cell division protein Fic [Bifidobacterium italicum]